MCVCAHVYVVCCISPHLQEEFTVSHDILLQFAPYSRLHLHHPASHPHVELLSGALERVCHLSEVLRAHITHCSRSLLLQYLGVVQKIEVLQQKVRWVPDDIAHQADCRVLQGEGRGGVGRGGERREGEGRGGRGREGKGEEGHTRICTPQFRVEWARLAPTVSNMHT